MGLFDLATIEVTDPPQIIERGEIERRMAEHLFERDKVASLAKLITDLDKDTGVAKVERPQEPIDSRGEVSDGGEIGGDEALQQVDLDLSDLGAIKDVEVGTLIGGQSLHGAAVEEPPHETERFE